MARKKMLRPRPVLSPGARTIGIDPSLAATGVAVYSDSAGWRTGLVRSAPIAAGTGKPALRSLFERLDGIRDGVREFVGGWRPDDLVVVVEGYMILGQGAGRGPMVANWHHIVGDVVAAGVEPVEIAPATRAKYATGGGSGGKDRVMSQAWRRFPEAAVDTNDEADAVFLVAIGRHLAGASIEPRVLPTTHLSVDRLFAAAE